jgi:uncharacterized RmlC-like cupin family protein
VRNSPATGDEDVKVFHEGFLQGEAAAQFAETCLAEVTHLPTGVPSGRSETVTVAAGSALAADQTEPSALVLHVVTGSATILWGGEPRRSAIAGPGDTVLVPGGLSYCIRNASEATDLQFVRIRSS